MSASLGTKELGALIEVSLAVNSHLGLNDVLQAVMSVTADVMGAEAASLAIRDDDTGDLIFHVAQGDSADAVQSVHLKPGEGVIGWVVESGESTLVNDVSTDDRFLSDVDEASGFVTRSILCVPLRTSTQTLGAIEVMNKIDGSDFTDMDVVLCEAIASQAAMAIENAMLHKQVVQSERMAAIGQTVAGLGHCIKNVLNGIQGGGYMVDSAIRKDDAAQLERGWGIVKKNNIFMQELVLDMLHYSKEREPEYETCDVNEIVESVCDLMAVKGEEKGVKVTWAVNETLRAISVDPKGIRRCLLNLVSNAVDACEGREGDRVVHVASQDGDDVMFRMRVSDTGCGLSDEARQNLFKMFFSTKGSKGTGLGLAVTHKIVAEHGGSIDVESEIDTGTTFVVSLPREKVSL